MRSEASPRPSPPYGLPTGPACAAPSAAIDRRGLVLGDGTCLARFGRDGGLALAADRERVLTLLSVAAGGPVPAAVLTPLAVASEHWRRGDRTLANLRLVFAGLPRLASEADVANVRDAADILDGGMAPRALMKALGFDAAALDKFDPDQPRVPAGSGRTSGRWTDGAGGGADEAEGLVEGRSAARDGVPVWPAPSRSTPAALVIPVTDDEPVKPGGQFIVPRDSPDPLDPFGLNTLLTLEEEKAVAKTINLIRAGEPTDQAVLRSHRYKNFPNEVTGAQLPLGDIYTSHYMRETGALPGTVRLVTGATGSVYYTRNHFQSFFKIGTP